MPRVKICCIQNVEEARMAVEAGADAIGLVSAMPSGPGPIPEESIRVIAREVSARIETFLLTCLQDAGEIIAQHRRCRTSTIQLVDRLTSGSCAELRAALPGVRIVQAIHVCALESVDEAREAAQAVDALLLDSGNPALEVKELGGTGRVHDWQISRQIRQLAGIPVYLAGGLTADNVAEAIRTVEPFGVDVCSGVRTKGRLHRGKLARFINGARRSTPG